MEILKHFLDDHQVRYITIRHSLAYTAQEIAERAHVKGNRLAKTVVVKVDNQPVMIVLPAPYHVDLEGLAAALRSDSATLAEEPELASLFSDCEMGAMPPFGNLWDMPVYLAQPLADQTTITFNAGSHTELVEIGMADYRRLVKPEILDSGFEAPGETPPRVKHRSGRNAPHVKPHRS